MCTATRFLEAIPLHKITLPFHRLSFDYVFHHFWPTKGPERTVPVL